MQQFFDCPFEVKFLSDEGTLEGYGSVFHVADRGNDVVAPGAFAERSPVPRVTSACFGNTIPRSPSECRASKVFGNRDYVKLNETTCCISMGCGVIGAGGSEFPPVKSICESRV